MGRTEQRLDVAGALRELRRRADLSQRELATRSGVPAATVGSIESGASPNPGFRTVERLVAATGAQVTITDLDGSEPAPSGTDGLRDAAQRRLPAHLDPRWVAWHGARRIDRFGFIRDRRIRDLVRRERAGEERYHRDYEIRRLGPADPAVLAALRATADELDLAGRPAPPGAELTSDAALRYLRDPAVRHWIARQRGSRQILAHLVARVHRHHTGQSAMLVTEIGVRPEHRRELAGIRLVAAVSDDAVRLGVSEVHAVPDHPAVARYLRGLGFRRRHRRAALLTLVG